MRKIYGIMIASAGLITGVWAGCTVDDSAEIDGVFPCTIETDCIDGYECRDNFCYKRAVSNNIVNCIDNDNDGYGVGTPEERQKCSLCETLGLCEEDCNDNDNTISPGAGEACNGRDDNCNQDIDEPTACASSQDCESLRPYIPANTSVSCENQQCVVKMTTQFCTDGRADCPCTANPVACTSGMYDNVPDPGMCL
ncbi:MAG: putative metal-binding motif-containing protein [bacterium]